MEAVREQVFDFQNIDKNTWELSSQLLICNKLIVVTVRDQHTWPFLDLENLHDEGIERSGPAVERTMSYRFEEGLERLV